LTLTAAGLVVILLPGLAAAGLSIRGAFTELQFH
jgi:hypothetical protein